MNVCNAAEMSVKPAWSSERQEIQHMEDDIKDNIPLLKRLRDHGESSNVHGISHMLTRRTKFRRIIWKCAFLGLFSFASYQLMNIYMLYISYPTQTNVEVEFKPLLLPFFSICNINPVRSSIVHSINDKLLRDILSNKDISADIQNYRQTFGKVLYDDYSDVYYGDLDAGQQEVGNISDDFITQQLFMTKLAELEWSERTRIGHQLDNMVMECQFRGSDCVIAKRASIFLSASYGNCYTVNTTGLISGTAGPTGGLKMVINLETYETVDFSEGYGLVLVLHEEDEFVIPESDGIVLSGGSETQIRMKLTKIKRKPPPYSTCREVSAKVSHAYTYAECLNDCISDIYSKECSCELISSYFYSDYEKSDGLFKVDCRGSSIELDCSKKWYKQVLKDVSAFCSCPPPCRENVYTTSISSRDWPTTVYREQLAEQVCKPNQNCSFDRSSITEKQLEANFLKLMLYFDDLNHEVIEQIPIYDATQLLSDIGGSLGLCLGVSLLCVVELIEVILEIAESIKNKILKK